MTLLSEAFGPSYKRKLCVIFGKESCKVPYETPFCLSSAKFQNVSTSRTSKWVSSWSASCFCWWQQSMVCIFKYLSTQQARRKRWAWGLQSAPHSLLTFVDFLGEKAVKAKVIGMKIRTHTYLRKLYQNLSKILHYSNISKLFWKESHQS